jgi:hypothetical protein
MKSILMKQAAIGSTAMQLKQQQPAFRQSYR